MKITIELDGLITSIESKDTNLKASDLLEHVIRCVIAQGYSPSAVRDAVNECINEEGIIDDL